MFIALFVYAAVIGLSPVFTEQGDISEYIPCENGWYYWGQKCYKKKDRKNPQKFSWNQALEKCRSYGGDLASIQSHQEQVFIFPLLQLDIKDWAWIGLNDRDKEGYFKWSDGSLLGYTNWYEGQPSKVDDTGQKADCVHLSFDPALDIAPDWSDISCDSLEPQYICEKKSDPNETSLNPLYCSSKGAGGWKWEKSCYHVVMEEKSWEDAEKHCKNYYGGHLVSILDRLEDIFLDYILGNITNDLWIGVKIQEKLQQRWSSGWYVSYDGFRKETPFREGTCGTRRKRQKWKTFPCVKKLPFICHVSKENPPVLKSPEEGSYCPLDFDLWRDLGGEYCYYFQTEKAVDFEEALLGCKKRGGNLLSLHSKEESDTILPFVKYNRLGRSFYIGLSRRWPREEEFVWTDGSAVDYENWQDTIPYNINKKCVEVYTGYMGEYLYRWNDIYCTEKRGYICSVRKTLSNSTSKQKDEFAISPKPPPAEEDSHSCSIYLKALIGMSVCTSLVIILMGVVAYRCRTRSAYHGEKTHISFHCTTSSAEKLSEDHL